MNMEVTTTALDMSGVRISPPELRFLDAVPGGCYRALLSVQNLEPQSRFLQILPPQRPQFKLIVENPKKPVASGLRITASVEYFPDREEDLRDRLLLYVDKKIIEIPLIGLFPCCCLEMEPEINFGTVIANSKVISNEIKITNHGSSSGSFNINYSGSVHIVISPTSGVVESKTFQVVKMEICADIPRVINETAIVELQGRSSAHITIKANIVEQIVELLGVPHSDTIKHVHFGCVYFGTSKTEEIILHNKSPEAMDWVAILQDNAVGEEMGTDIQKGTDAALQDLNYSENKPELDVSTLISCIPNEGTLEPYQKIVVTLCFSPKQLKRNMKHGRSPSRQDYSLFLKFEAVGSTNDFLQRLTVDDKLTRENSLHKVELALTGSGLPVMLTFSPGPVINFMACYMGEHTDIICTLKNECDILPVSFAFRKIAHYNICPEKGKVKAKSSQDVLFSFLPRHIGSFKVKQVVDIIGPVTKKDCLPELVIRSFHQIHLKFCGTCKSVTNKAMLQTSLGVLVSNKEDQYSYVTPMALLKSDQTEIHDHVLNRNLDDALIALPNDRPASIRPSERHNNYRTIFTKVARYNYVDPEYSYTAYEELEKQVNKDYYADYIHNLRKHRLNKEGARIFEKLNNSVDLGLQPASGLKSPRLKALWKDKLEEDTDLENGSGLLTSKKLAEIKSKSMDKEVDGGLNAVPSTPQEHEDCSLILTSKQLHQIFIGPSTIDFGEVCVHSTSTRKMYIVNNLPVHVWIQVGIESEELQQTSPLSHVMPPHSQTYIPVVFETDKLGHFQKSFMYTINQHHIGHVLVVAKIVPVALELSTRELTLYPTFSFLAESGFRTTVTLYNRKNYPAQFIWKPIITDKGMAFSICPEKGTVEAYKDLECEVVWHPSFSSPVTGEFDLCVHQGKTLRLKCFAKLGSTSVQFKEQRITFNHAPIHLTTCKTAILQNVGHNHAYFQVVDANPLPGMIITPFQGVVPVGGRTELKIYFTPNALMKFDSRVEVAVRHAKSLELRIGGSVAVPNIELSTDSFVFHGVYVGSTQKIPFLIENKGKTRARVTFDLSNHDDFTLHFTLQPDACSSPPGLCLYTVAIDAHSALECLLNFTPKEVAAYDFNLLIHVNVSKTSSSSDNTLTNTSPASSAKHLIVPHPQMLTIPTQLCKVQATVLQPPLELYYQDLTFLCNLRTIQLGIVHDRNSIKKLHLNNISKQQLMWKLDLDAAGKAVDDGFFKFSLQSGILGPGQHTAVTISFCPPSCHGTYMAEVPLLLNDDTSVYRILSLLGCVKIPKISFDPQILILTPVPLNIKTGADVHIIPQGYSRKTTLQAEIPACDPGHNDQINPLSVEISNGSFIDVTLEGKNIGFVCHVNFCSSKPMSCMKTIYFVDEEKNRFPLLVTATAENCLLTVYPYLACHLKDQKIILKSDSNEIIYSNGERLQHPCYIPGTCSQTNSTSNFGIITNSAYEKSIAEFEKEVENERLKKSKAISQVGANLCYLDHSLFPAEGTEAYAFLQKVIAAVQNWFTLFGWSKGPNPISIPRTLRCDVCKIQMTSSDEKLKQNLAKDTKTIYDILLHLSGQLLPGISSSQSLPFDPTQRVVQLHWQHSTMVTFLKCQGALFSHVLPQFLLDLDDYKRWIDLQSMLKVRQSESENIYILDDCIFEAICKRSWTDVLLQIYKILVLQRVSTIEANTLNSPEDEEIMPKISTDPLSSNIYSPSERILLTWMNRQYEKTRKIVWKDSQKGDIPPTRWIVNFDRDLQDGLVLAAQVASYCPYLISTHFVNMYTYPKTSEQYLHNCLVLINAFHAINLDIDVLASDICDPNPIMMLMLCVYLYERLPQYLPKKYIEFSGPLHATVVRKIHLKNPSIKPLIYNATILGRDSADFSLPKGNTVTIAPKSQISINVEFTSRFLHPAEAMLLLVSKALTGVGGATMTFSLKTRINQIKLAGFLKCRSPCYELKTVILKVKSPFKISGSFSVIIVESTSCINDPEQLNQVSQIKQSKTKSSEIGILKTTCNVIGTEGFYEQQDNSNSFNKSCCLQEFFSPVNVAYLEAESSSSLNLHYLPFNMGKHYCAMIFINEQIGEFVYLVEGTCGLPLPSALLPMDSPNVLCISSMLKGQSETQPVLCLKCCLTDILVEKLKIPLINEAREKALAIAAQLQMSALEYERRRITGTLESSSVRAAVAALGLSTIEKNVLHNLPAYSEQIIEYSVEVSMPDYFEIPCKIHIPVLASARVNAKHLENRNCCFATKTEAAAVELSIKFIPQYPGRYPCQILLQSKYDIRTYNIECVVNTDTIEAELEFVTPAYQAVIQDIPITNTSKQDWKLKATLKGCSFYGPPLIYVAPGETTTYTLIFKPTTECITKGKLILQNEADGTDHVFTLVGIATKPLALDHILIDCSVRQITQKVIMVPNFTRNELRYKVFSDLLIISGDPTLTVGPGDTAAYTLTISPWKRGKMQGIISFVAEDGEQQQHQFNSSLKKTYGTQELQAVNAANTGQNSPCSKVWFALEINSVAAPPEKTLDVECETLDTTVIEIPITNPTNDILVLDVLIDVAELSGEKNLILQPKETVCYGVKYSPACTGSSKGSVIFVSEKTGEFWYALRLTAKKPLPRTLPEVECELGKWVRQYIPLVNPTYESLELKVVNNNSAHYSLDIDSPNFVIVAPCSTTKVPVQFCPSTLGRACHTAKISFMCPQLEEWVFFLSGVGLIPKLQEPANVSACLGYHSSIIITFRNPTFKDVLVDVILTEQEHVTHPPSDSALHHSINKESVFWLPLKQTQGISLPPKSKLDIPVLFAPQSMKLYEAVLVINVEKFIDENWSLEDLFELNSKLSSSTVISESGEIKALRWIYPICGIPEAPPYKSAPAVVCCQARSRVEERVEVLLTGVVPSARGSQIVRDSATPLNSKSVTIQDEVQVTEGFFTADEFLYDLEFESERVKSQLQSAVAINLVENEWDPKTGIVTLVFSTVFAPNKPMRTPATLVVQCITGGIWKFPLLLVATEPEVDDVINIEAAGLNKESLISFRLTSKTRYPEPYTAHFLPGSDPEFVVSPQAGELLPLDTAGTLITIGFTPNMYSKKHRATLVIQTAGMQWMYEINGLPPWTAPPTTSAKVVCRNTYEKSTTVQQRNFLRENMKLLSTGVSSTIKGAPLILRAK
ncbi:cilia- and flagella-associated protein 47 [Heteronotia binoei]|uniref:cilia- and flagella-associated protein 47 n=1 Tax=Heteronotia binoei TaxID=13085 RepID=UPI00292FB338|nr:cilia- and flagella-associated protein 47 [Heteronotia binoei]